MYGPRSYYIFIKTKNTCQKQKKHIPCFRRETQQQRKSNFPQDM